MILVILLKRWNILEVVGSDYRHWLNNGIVNDDDGVDEDDDGDNDIDDDDGDNNDDDDDWEDE